MATAKDTSTFFLEADAEQFDNVLKLYPQAIKLKAEQRTKKPEELIKLDNWYQNELPKMIKARGKDAHMVHEELVQLMKWKQARGKFFPQLSYLIKVNTPRAVMQETKKAFRKLPNIESAIAALSNLKGVGTATASALLAAASPDIAPFMADECVQAIPEMEGSDFTAKEYLNFVKHIKNVCDRLNKEQNGCGKWLPHMVELAIWTHNIVSDLRPELLGKAPKSPNAANGVSPLPSDESNLEPPTNGNGKLTVDSVNEDTTTSCTEDSMDAKPASPATPASPSDNSDSAFSTPRAKRLCTAGERCLNPYMERGAGLSPPRSPSAGRLYIPPNYLFLRPIEEASSAEENSLEPTEPTEPTAPADAPPAKKLREATH